MRREIKEPLVILLLLVAAAECSAQQYHAGPSTRGNYEPGQGGPDDVTITLGEPSAAHGGKVWTQAAVDSYNEPADYSWNVSTGEVTELAAATRQIHLTQYQPPQGFENTPHYYCPPRPAVVYVQYQAPRVRPVFDWVFGPNRFWVAYPQQQPLPPPQPQYQQPLPPQQ